MNAYTKVKRCQNRKGPIHPKATHNAPSLSQHPKIQYLIQNISKYNRHTYPKTIIADS